MIDLEKAVAESVKLDMDTDHTVPINTFNPELLNTMKYIFDESQPEQGMEETIQDQAERVYYCAKITLTKIPGGPRGELLPEVLYSYYVKLYNLTCGVNYAIATLRLFDVFEARPRDNILRRTLCEAVDSWTDVVRMVSSGNASIPLKVLTPRYTVVHEIASSVDKFTHKRFYPTHKGYLRWMKDFLAKTLLQPDLFFVEVDNQVLSVSKQLRQNAASIKL